MRNESILNVVKDLASAFLYYDRQEDEDLPEGVIEDAIRKGEISVEDIVEVFKQELVNNV